MLTCSLQSGSNGNAIYVEANGVRLLFDAGISGRQADQRLRTHGREIRDIDALIISHDHADHVRCAGIYHRKFRIPIYMTTLTERSVRRSLGVVSNVHRFQTGDRLTFGPVTVHTFATPHDAMDGAAFIVECEGKRLGIMTDLGHPFRGLLGALAWCDAAYLESNHDVDMLAFGPYPQWLKNRVSGAGGHLSNAQAADLLQRCGKDRPCWVALSHLSQENNEPEIALETNRSAVGKLYPFTVASRHDVSPLMEV